MPLGFKNNAIILSNETGTKIKSAIISDYYKLWWEITSGNISGNFRHYTSIIEMHAATGEIYIEETDETLLGSAGHALKLKLDRNQYETRNLKIICIEQDKECFKKLKNVINSRWPQVDIGKTEAPLEDDDTNIYLIHSGVDESLKKLRG